METWSFFRSFQRKQLQRYLAKQRAAKLITIFLFLGVLLGVGFVLYYFLSSGFSFLAQEPGVPALVTYYMYELFILVLALLVLASSVISSLFLLFGGREHGWVMATPAYRMIFFYQTSKVLFSSLWPLIVLIVPALLAVRQVFNLSIANVLLSFVAVLVFTAFLVIMTVVGIMSIAWLLTKLSPPNRQLFPRLITALCLCAIIAAVSMWQWLRANLLFDLVRIDRLTDVSQAVSVISNRFIYLPSHLPATILYALQSGRLVDVLTPFLSLGLFLLGSCALLVVFSHQYLYLWQRMQEGSLQAKTVGLVRKSNSSAFIGFLGQQPSAVRAFMGKEGLLLYRDKKHFLWFCFLVFIWLVQTALVSGIGHTSSDHTVLRSVQPTLQALQFLITVYFVSTFVLRFVFPAFSMESRTAWIIASAPLDLKKVMHAKLRFYWLVLVILGIGVGGINVFLLQVPLTSAVLSIGAFVISILFLVTLGLTLGILFPNFDTDDPQILSTSLPGLTFIFLALGYGGIGSLLLYYFVTSGVVYPLLLLLLTSVLLIPLLMKLSVRALTSLEMVRTV